MLADVLHEGSIDPRHERGDGFPGVVGRPIASPTNLELQTSGCRGLRTLSQDLLDSIVVLLGIVVVRIGLMFGVVQGHMPATEVGFPHTELTLVALPELSVTHLDAVGVLTNPADHLAGCEPGLGAVGAQGAGSDHPHRVSHPELLRCRARGGLLTLSMLLFKLLADVPRRLLLPREELLGIHSHAITRQGKSPTQGVPAKQNLVRGQAARSGGVMMGLESRPHLLEPVPPWIGDVDLAQLLEQLPSSHFSTAVRPAEIGNAFGMSYSHEGTHSLEPATSKLGPSVTANGAGDVKDGQPMTNHHDCHFLGKQPLFACRNGYNVAAVAVHTENHTVKGLLANVHFGHGEDVHGHALHGLVRNRGPLGFPLDVPVIILQA